MAQLPLKINGYSYTIGCADGEEAHLADMAAELDTRIGAIRGQAGQMGEAKLLVIAALTMTDEIHDLKLALETARGTVPAREPDEPDRAEMQAALDRAAARLEGVARRLTEA